MYLSRKVWTWGTVVLAVGAIGALMGAASGGASGTTPSTTPSTAPSTVTVHGTGSVSVTPDTANVTLGATSQAKDATTALQQGGAAMQSVIQAVEAQGINAKDIRTSGLNLNPMYANTNNGQPGTIIGYRVYENAVATVQPLSKLGPVIDAAVKAGSNQVNGVSFSYSNPSSSYQQAYAAALKDAQEQADAIASGLGQHIVGVLSVQAGSSGGTLPGPIEYQAAAAPSTPVMPGTQQVRENVTVVYQISS